MVNNVQNADEFGTAIKSGKLVVVDFFATWCGPCKQIAPFVSKLSSDFPNADFLKVDVDELGEVAEKAGVSAMPTFILYKDGEPVETVVGANAKALEAAVKKHYD